MAEAAALGIAETAPAAFRGLDYLLEHGRAAGGRPGYPHILHGDGSVCDARRDCYDHAFVLIALASLFKISRDAQIAALIDEVVQFLDIVLVSPGGGYLEGAPHTGPRRQNPHMHLFEAFIGLYEATGNPDYATRAAALLAASAVGLVEASRGGQPGSSALSELSLLLAGELDGACRDLALALVAEPPPAVQEYPDWFEGVEVINGDHSDSEDGYLYRQVKAGMAAEARRVAEAADMTGLRQFDDHSLFVRQKLDRLGAHLG